MSKLVCNIGGINQFPVSVTVAPFVMTVNNFCVFAALEGKQIVIEWDIIYNGITKLRLVRKQFSYPENINDGVILLDETPITSIVYNDFNIEDNTAYYYKLFGGTGTDLWLTEDVLQGYDFSCITGFFRNKLYDLLPDIYKTLDVSKDGRLKSYNKSFQPNFNEFVNIHETNNKTYGQLYRFLINSGTQLDFAKCFIDFMPKLWDVENSPLKFLQYIANLVGVVFNFDLPGDKQRIEIKEAVANYKTKGTIPGIIAHTQKITGFITTIDEKVRKILVSNDQLRVSWSDTLNSQIFMGTCGDPTYYSLDLSINGKNSFDTLLICIDVNNSKILDKRIVQKLIRTLRDWIPSDTKAIVIFIDKNTSIVNSPQPHIDSQTNSIINSLTFLLANDQTLISNVSNIVSLNF